MRNKTLAVWLTLLLGPLGLHRLYIVRTLDMVSWALFLPSAAGIYGLSRAARWGVDDPLSWLLMPCLGLTIFACALNAIVYGLMEAERWNQRFNPQAPADAAAGRSTGLTVVGLVLSLLLGATALLSVLAFSFDHYLKYLGT